VSGALPPEISPSANFLGGVDEKLRKKLLNMSLAKHAYSDTVVRDKLAPLENILLRGKTGWLCRSWSGGSKEPSEPGR
jgi:hypothetical protein